MSNFPTSLDDDVTLPRVDNNITEIGDIAVNALRDSVFSIEEEIGVLTDGYTAKGSRSSLAVRLGQSIEHDGTIKSSAIASLGLVTLPITGSQISATAAIAESKLSLDHSTASLYNYINNINSNQNTALNFINNSGFKMEPHLAGATYRHVLSHIDIGGASDYFKDKKGLYRNNTNLLTLFTEVNKEFVAHQKADATVLAADPTSTLTGTIPPDNYAHVSSGIFLNTDNFAFIPQTTSDLQQFAQFIDNSNVFLLGSRIQTLYQNGISRTSRSASLLTSESGQNVIPYTLAYAHLSGIDDIDTGDDIITFSPSLDGYVFDAQFSKIKIGDIATVNYGSVIVSFIVKEKLITSGLTYRIRINGKNLFNTATAQVKIDHSLFNDNKQGVLALAAAPLPGTITGAYPSLTVGSPRGAEVLGVCFNPDLLDSTHYKLYLQFFSTGNPSEATLTLAPIDVTGNLGKTPGLYTLDSVVNSMNAAFRRPGFNYRFIAYPYKGEIGLKLADAVGNASFSIISGVVDGYGVYSQSLTNTIYSKNVVGLFDDKDALGFGPNNANLASPPYTTSFTSPDGASNPTKIFAPLTKKTFYVNGAERERLNLEPNQDTDTYGDSYWPATIATKLITGSRVKVTYQVNRDLRTSGLKIGKTILVQPETGGSVVDFGRFTIEDIVFNSCACDGYTEFVSITVYDAIHSTGVTPYLSANVGTAVRLYFSGDSIGVSTQNSSDADPFTIYKRHLETYINQDGNTFTHERARINVSGATQIINGIDLYGDVELTTVNLYKVSPKLRGYAFSSIKKINLSVTSYDITTGIFSGSLCKWDGASATNVGPITTGKKGDVVRFYDETNIDYIDVIFNANDTITAIGSVKRMDIQLFSSLSLDDDVMMLGTCQITDSNKTITYLRDERQFGNTSEKQLSSSALDYISASTQLLNENGIIRGFDILTIPTGITPYANVVSVAGGVAVINGKIIQVNNSSIAIPVIKEALYPTFATTVSNITWFLCVNDKSELELIASTDYDISLSGTYGSLDHTRMFYVKNPNVVSLPAYSIRGTYFNDLILNNKNVTPIATITTTTGSSPFVITAASSVDMRRFIGNGFNGLTQPFTLGSKSNFRNVDSLIGWINQLTKFKSFTVNDVNNVGATVLVKDNVDISGKAFVFGAPIKFVGDGGKFTITTPATMTNIHLENLKINTSIGSAITFSGVQNNITQCYFSHATTAGVYPLVIATSSSARFTDNIFTSSVSPTAFVNCIEATLKQIFIGNVYKSGQVLTAATNVLPATITTLNSSDGA